MTPGIDYPTLSQIQLAAERLAGKILAARYAELLERDRRS